MRGQEIKLYQPKRRAAVERQNTMQARYEEATLWCRITSDAAIMLGVIAFAEAALLVFRK